MAYDLTINATHVYWTGQWQGFANEGEIYSVPLDGGVIGIRLGVERSAADRGGRNACLLDGRRRQHGEEGAHRRRPPYHARLGADGRERDRARCDERLLDSVDGSDGDEGREVISSPRSSRAASASSGGWRAKALQCDEDGGGPRAEPLHLQAKRRGQALVRILRGRSSVMSELPMRSRRANDAAGIYPPFERSRERRGRDRARARADLDPRAELELDRPAHTSAQDALWHAHLGRDALRRLVHPHERRVCLARGHRARGDRGRARPPEGGEDSPPRRSPGGHAAQ